MFALSALIGLCLKYVIMTCLCMHKCGVFLLKLFYIYLWLRMFAQAYFSSLILISEMFVILTKDIFIMPATLLVSNKINWFCIPLVRLWDHSLPQKCFVVKCINCWKFLKIFLHFEENLANSFHNEVREIKIQFESNSTVFKILFLVQNYCDSLFFGPYPKLVCFIFNFAPE